MVNYILRRVLLMIPTLIGITFLVFMLIAMSPGGIGAGLQVQAGGSMQSQNSIAVQRAKIDDRYGLNESVVTQYFRWLGRISPIKFGQRDMIAPTGELIAAPRRVPEPAAWQWLGDTLPSIDATVRAATTARLLALTADARAAEFRTIERAYIDARADFHQRRLPARRAGAPHRGQRRPPPGGPDCPRHGPGAIAGRVEP